jgi:ribosomal protein S18 acetylase RimI-like enzyme
VLIRPVHTRDRDRLLAIAVSTGLFSPDDAEGLLGEVLDGLAANALPQGHTAVAIGAEGAAAAGWAYYAPDPYADGVWNLWWIGVHPDHHSNGVGHALLVAVEQDVAAHGARLLIIETSDLAPTTRARAFYTRVGYQLCGRIPDFYAAGDAKLIFSKQIAVEAASTHSTAG